MGTGLEVEIKLPVADPEEIARKLLALGARAVEPRLEEENWLFDFPDRRLRQRGAMVRLRTAGGRSLVTLKEKLRTGPDEFAEGDYKVRKEIETAVSTPAAIHALTRVLGMEVVYHYQKRRRAFRRDDLLITLDELPIGCWIELEGAPLEIDRTAADLGYTRSDYITLTYRALHQEILRRRGLEDEPTDMSFPAPEDR